MSRNIVIRRAGSRRFPIDTGSTASPLPMPVSPASVSLTRSRTPLTTRVPPGTVVGIFETPTPGGADSFTFSILRGSNSHLFTLDGNKLKTAGLMPEEGTYILRVQTSDGLGFTFSQSFEFTVHSADGVPIAGEAASGATAAVQSLDMMIGTLTSNDPSLGVTDTYTLAGPSSDIVGAKQEPAVVFQNAAPASYDLGVRLANSLGQTTDTTISIVLNPSVLTPTDLLLSNSIVDAGLTQGNLAGAVEATAFGTDPAYIQELVAAPDVGQFRPARGTPRKAVTFRHRTRAAFGPQRRVTDAVRKSPGDLFVVAVNALQLAPQDAGHSAFVTVERNPDAGFSCSLSTESSGPVNPGRAPTTVVQVSAATSFDISVRLADAAGLTIGEQFSGAAERDGSHAAIRLTDSMISDEFTVGGVIATVAPAGGIANTALTTTIVPRLDGTLRRLTTHLFTTDPRENVLKANTVIRVKGPSKIPAYVQTTGPAGGTREHVFTHSVMPAGGAAVSRTLPPPITTDTPVDEAVVNAVVESGPNSGVETALLDTGAVVGTASTPHVMPADNAAMSVDATHLAAMAAVDVGAPMLAPVSEMREEPPLPAFDPSQFTFSVSAGPDSPSFEVSEVSSISMSATTAPRPEPLPSDRMFANTSDRQQEMQVDDVDLALWALQAPDDQVALMRAAVDDQVFTMNQPGTGEWGLSVLGSAAALKSYANEREEDKNAFPVVLPPE